MLWCEVLPNSNIPRHHHSRFATIFALPRECAAGVETTVEPRALWIQASREAPEMATTVSAHQPEPRLPPAAADDINPAARFVPKSAEAIGS